MYRRDMYKTYDNEEFEYDYPISFKLRNKFYLESDNTAAITWDYGDTAVLSFELKKEAEDSEFDFSRIMVEVSFYNFRGAVIHTKSIQSNQMDGNTMEVNVDIDEDISSKVFRKGIYVCSVAILDVENSKRKTVLPYGELRIRVK